MSRLIILCAGDIMLLTQSISELQLLLTACEQELLWLEMSINCKKKSCCMRIGPRFNIRCNSITTSSCFDLPWVNEIRYIDIYIVKSRSFKCSFDHAKRAFYRSLNAIFGHIGRSASDEVVINLVTHKFLPITYCYMAPKSVQYLNLIVILLILLLIDS